MTAMQDLKLKDIVGTWLMNGDSSVRLIIGEEEVEFFNDNDSSKYFHEPTIMYYLGDSKKADEPYNTFKLSDRIILFMKSRDDKEIDFKIDGHIFTFARRM